MTESKQPTPAEVKDLLEWCGLTYFDGWFYDGQKRVLIYGVKPGLDFLFKYAAPKLLGQGNTISVTCSGKYKDYDARIYDKDNNIRADCPCMDDPALALFWAIWSVFHADR
jgi:hypothetical protein